MTLAVWPRGGGGRGGGSSSGGGGGGGEPLVLGGTTLSILKCCPWYWTNSQRGRWKVNTGRGRCLYELCPPPTPSLCVCVCDCHSQHQQPSPAGSREQIHDRGNHKFVAWGCQDARLHQKSPPSPPTLGRTTRFHFITI